MAGASNSTAARVACQASTVEAATVLLLVHHFAQDSALDLKSTVVQETGNAWVLVLHSRVTNIPSPMAIASPVALRRLM